MHESDEALLERARLDEVDAFEGLYDRYVVPALRVARAICRDSGRAEEVVQESFMEIWRRRHAYPLEAGRFGAWVTTVVKHRAIDRLRAEGRRPQLIDRDISLPDQTSRVPHEEVEARDEAEEVAAALGNLPLDQAEVIRMAFYGQMTHEEISAALDLPLGTVKGRIRLGLEKLRHFATFR